MEKKQRKQANQRQVTPAENATTQINNSINVQE